MIRRPSATALSGRARFLFVFALSLFAAGLAHGATLSENNINQTSSPYHSRIEIRLDEPIDLRVVNQMDAGNKPFFFIDFYKTQASFPDKIIPLKDGILGAIQTVSYPDLQVLRIIFYPVNKTAFRVADAATLHTYPHTAISATKLPADHVRTSHIIIDTCKDAKTPFPTLTPVYSAETRRDPLSDSAATKHLVVIDPGHGGDDPGTISPHEHNGITLQEKALALSMAAELCRLLNKTPNVKAILTRNRDKAMSLRERVEFSQRMPAHLFVSIHVNSTEYATNRTARGVDFFYFSDDSKNEKNALVEAENAAGEAVADPQGKKAWIQIASNLTKDILARHRGESAQLCEHLSDAFNQDAYFRKNNRGVKSAPFRVLMNMESAAVLIETGFIDNKEEADLLAKPAFQQRIAKLTCNGILRHFAQLDSEFEYYQF